MDIKELEDIAKHGLTLAEDLIKQKIPYCVKFIEEISKIEHEQEFRQDFTIEDLSDDIQYNHERLFDFYRYIDTKICTEKELGKMKKQELVDLVCEIFKTHEEINVEL